VVRKRGRLIVLEGLDGAGKSTVQRALLRRWKAAGWRVAGRREPANPELGARAIAAAPVAPSVAALYFTLDRLLARPAVERLLAQGRLVLQDRSFYSTLAYQGSLLPAEHRRELEKLQRYVAIVPDLVALLDVPPSEGLRRVVSRGGPRSPIERLRFLKRVAKEYRRLAKRDHWLVVNARSPLPEVVRTIDQVVARVRRNRKSKPGKSRRGPSFT
jgi:dTMP kinase